MKHQINLIDDTPVKQRHHCIPYGMYNELKKHLEMILDAEVTRESRSHWASPFNLVLMCKKDNLGTSVLISDKLVSKLIEMLITSQG